MQDGRNERVSSLFIPGTKQWDVTLVKDRFQEEDVSAILATYVPQQDVRDRVAWSQSLTGHYNVKMGYKLWHNQHMGTNQVPHNEGWNKIWRVAIPHKI